MATAVQPVTFSTAAFRAEREADWATFDALLTRLEKGSLRGMPDEDLIALPLLYRSTLASLSIARATSLDAALLDYLEGLAMRGYFLLYGVRESRMARFKRFFSHDWPMAVQALRWETLVIALAIILGAIAAYYLSIYEPEWFNAFVPGEMAQGRDFNASKQELHDTIFNNDASEDALHVFATFLFTHNSQVSIMAYALGFAFGLPTLMLEMYQGLMLGAMVAVFVKAGLGVDFGGWLAIHGTTELFAAALAGAAGLKIGTAFAFPGTKSRMEASAEAGKKTGAAMVGVILMLMVAGFLEGFGRQLIQVTSVRYAIGFVMLALWIVYFYTPRKSSSGANP